MAAMACATWYSNDDPPTIVEPSKRGSMPRYSASAKTDSRLCAVAQKRPSTSLRLSPQSSSARLVPCAIRSMTDMPSATWPRSASATPTIAAAARLRPCISRLHGIENWHRRFLALGTVCAKFDAHTDANLLRGDALDPAHQPEALVTVDQGNVVGGAFRRMHDSGRVDRAQALAHTPFEPIASREGTDETRIKDRTTRLRAELVGELAALEMGKICAEWRRLGCGHEAAFLA